MKKTVDHYDVIADVEKLIANVWKREDLTLHEKQIAAAVLQEVVECVRYRARKYWGVE